MNNLLKRLGWWANQEIRHYNDLTEVLDLPNLNRDSFPSINFSNLLEKIGLILTLNPEITDKLEDNDIKSKIRNSLLNLKRYNSIANKIDEIPKYIQIIFERYSLSLINDYNFSCDFSSIDLNSSLKAKAQKYFSSIANLNFAYYQFLVFFAKAKPEGNLFTIEFERKLFQNKKYLSQTPKDLVVYNNKRLFLEDIMTELDFLDSLTNSSREIDFSSYDVPISGIYVLKRDPRWTTPSSNGRNIIRLDKNLLEKPEISEFQYRKAA